MPLLEFLLILWSCFLFIVAFVQLLKKQSKFCATTCYNWPPHPGDFSTPPPPENLAAKGGQRFFSIFLIFFFGGGFLGFLELFYFWVFWTIFGFFRNLLAAITFYYNFLSVRPLPPLTVDPDPPHPLWSDPKISMLKSVTFQFHYWERWKIRWKLKISLDLAQTGNINYICITYCR